MGQGEIARNGDSYRERDSEQAIQQGGREGQRERRDIHCISNENKRAGRTKERERLGGKERQRERIHLHCISKNISMSLSKHFLLEYLICKSERCKVTFHLKPNTQTAHFWLFSPFKPVFGCSMVWLFMGELGLQIRSRSH